MYVCTVDELAFTPINAVVFYLISNSKLYYYKRLVKSTTFTIKAISSIFHVTFTVIGSVSIEACGIHMTVILSLTLIDICQGISIQH